VSVGHPFDLVLGPDGLVRVFTYGIDELRTLRVSRRGEALEAELVTRAYEVDTAVASGSIESSLFGAVTASGEDDQLALDLAEIFAWDVDFNTEIQRGDSFRVAVEKLKLDGRFVRYGRILSAEFRRGERVLRAIRFEGSQGVGYYAPDGTPLRKAFLRSPLKFSRISSRFTRARFHPILRKTRPHLGVDYAARPGTPVMAAGNGVVTLAGWWGGYGKAVRIRHANGYETLYGHLSRISVRRGQRVNQGTPVGTVGSTGLATGPHLDYRMSRNGVFVNPLKVQSPPAEPIPASEQQAFASARRERLALLAPVLDTAQVAEAPPAAPATSGFAGAADPSPASP
jgi:murein DD-endopeptidase MepM/ murein hydrolase activator NlpD